MAKKQKTAPINPMKVDIQCSPAYSIAYVKLAADESVRCVSGAMALMSAGIKASAGTGPGGIGGAGLRKLAGGTSFFMGKYTAKTEGAWVGLSPRYPGDVTPVPINGTFYAESGSLLALSDGLHVSVRPANIGNVLAKEGITLLAITGEGLALLSSYGAIQSFDLGNGQDLTVDTGHMVGYESHVKVDFGMLGGLVTAAASGEGLVSRFHGPGKVYIQTRAEVDIRNWLFPDRKQNRKG